MKPKKYAIVVLIICMLLCGSCSKPMDKDFEGTPLDVADAGKSDDWTPINASDNAGENNVNFTPEPTEPAVLNEKINVEMEIDKEYTVNGYTVTLNEMMKNDNVFITANTADKVYKLMDGYFVSGYICGRETGSAYMVVCSMNEEIYTTSIFRFDRTKEKVLKQTGSVFGELMHVIDTKMQIIRSIDLFGTWRGIRSFEITDQYKIEEIEPYLWEVTADASRNLTVACDIRARYYEDGKDTAILTGSIVTVVYIDSDFDFAVLKDVASGKLYKVYVESDGHGGYIVEDTGSEAGCFDNIQYYG